MITEVSRGDRTGQRGRAPATVCVLSGDVHHAYLAQAHLGDSTGSKVYPITCSPLHNYVPAMMKIAFRVTWSGAAEHLVRMLLGSISHVPPLTFDWERLASPYFGDEIATLTLDGREANLRLEQADTDADGTRRWARTASTCACQTPTDDPPTRHAVKPWAASTVNRWSGGLSVDEAGSWPRLIRAGGAFSA